MTAATIQAFFDEATFTVTYVAADPASGKAAIIDPVLDYDPASGRTSTTSAERVLGYIKEQQLQVEWILETHVHADHLTAAPLMKQRLAATTAIGQHVTAVQNTFKGVFNIKGLATDGSQFDRLFADEDTFKIGALTARVMHVPGHTPGCVAYVIGDAAFVGDTLFMPDFGTARTDFPGGSAAQLYDSIQKIFSLPDATRLFMCHDYKAPGRDAFAWETTVAEQRASNKHIHDGVSRDEFIAMREQRDSELGMPKLILPSIQVNVCAGDLPDAEDNNVRYLKIPIDAL